MNYDLLIRQSYHGTGGIEGYRFKVYNHKGRKLGELKDIPVKCGRGDIVSINNKLYLVSEEYSSTKPREYRSEVVYYELQRHTFEPNFDLGDIK